MSFNRIPQPYNLVNIIQDEPVHYGRYFFLAEKNGILYKWSYLARGPWERKPYQGFLLRD
jgi:hypothetical protein